MVAAWRETYSRWLGVPPGVVADADVGHRSHPQHAAVDDDRRAGHVRRLRRGEKGDYGGNLPGITGSADGHSRAAARLRRLVLLPRHRCRDLAGCDGVDGDALRRQLYRYHFGEQTKAALCRAVRGRTDFGLVLVTAGDVHNAATTTLHQHS